MSVPPADEPDESIDGLDDPTGDPGDGGGPTDVEDLGYADALEELEAILADLERDDLDVDVLGPKVRRAAALIRVCRAHIGAARVDIEQIVVDLDGDPAGTGPGGGDGPP